MSRLQSNFRNAYLLVGVFLSVVFSGATFADQKKIDYEDVPAYVNGEQYWRQKHRLYRAYLDQSEDRLSDFFGGWSDKSKPISQDDLGKLPPSFRHAYSIFEDFYQPKNLSRIGKPEWGDKQFSDVTYFVTQSDIEVIVSKELTKKPRYGDESPNIFRATLKNFRPRVQGKTRALYLDKDHEHALREFLGEEKAEAGYDGIMSTSKAVGESRKRQEYLNRFLKIYEGHWEGWRLITDPTITAINLNQNHDRAIVHFSLVYEGGEAEYKFEKGKWVLLKSEITWIA